MNNRFDEFADKLIGTMEKLGSKLTFISLDNKYFVAMILILYVVTFAFLLYTWITDPSSIEAACSGEEVDMLLNEIRTMLSR